MPRVVHRSLLIQLAFAEHVERERRACVFVEALRVRQWLNPVLTSFDLKRLSSKAGGMKGTGHSLGTRGCRNRVGCMVR